MYVDVLATVGTQHVVCGFHFPGHDKPQSVHDSFPLQEIKQRQSRPLQSRLRNETTACDGLFLCLCPRGEAKLKAMSCWLPVIGGCLYTVPCTATDLATIGREKSRWLGMAVQQLNGGWVLTNQIAPEHLARLGT